MTLFVNSCVRKGSRTKRLAGILLGKLGGEIEEINVSDITFPTVDEEFLKKRDGLIASNKWDDPLFKYARQFAEADQIVIAAPYWDLSFPAALKQYFEQINVIGITFEYSPEGTPISKCMAEKKSASLPVHREMRLLRKGFLSVSTKSAGMDWKSCPSTLCTAISIISAGMRWQKRLQRMRFPGPMP